MCILEADIERDRLRRPALHLRLSGRITTKFWPQRTRSAGSRSAAPSQRDMARFDQPLEPRPRQRREVKRKRAIEAQPGLAGAGSDRGRGAARGGRIQPSRPAFAVANKAAGSGLKRMRALKILVVVMGVMLIGGFAVWSRSSPAGCRAAAMHRALLPPPRSTIPRDARIEAMTAGADRLVLDLVLPEGGRAARRHRFGDGRSPRHDRIARRALTDRRSPGDSAWHAGLVPQPGRRWLIFLRHCTNSCANSCARGKAHLESRTKYSELPADTRRWSSRNPVSERLCISRSLRLQQPILATTPRRAIARCPQAGSGTVSAAF